MNDEIKYTVPAIYVPICGNCYGQLIAPKNITENKKSIIEVNKRITRRYDGLKYDKTLTVAHPELYFSKNGNPEEPLFCPHCKVRINCVLIPFGKSDKEINE